MFFFKITFSRVQLFFYFSICDVEKWKFKIPDDGTHLCLLFYIYNFSILWTDYTDYTRKKYSVHFSIRFNKICWLKFLFVTIYFLLFSFRPLRISISFHLFALSANLFIIFWFIRDILLKYLPIFTIKSTRLI